MIKHLFFDLDHTLWDFKRNSALTFSYIFEKNRLPVELDTFLEFYEPINERYWRLFRQEKINKETLRTRRLSDTFQKMKIEVAPESIHILADDYIAHLARYNYLFPKTLETLDYLVENYNLHIITNGFSEVQNKKMIGSKLDGYFKTLTTSDEVGVKKPAQEIFDSALTKAGAQKKESIMIGDDLEADIYGAENFGLRAIYLSPEETVSYKGTRIKKITELQNLL